jgi:hypothetical protein
MHGTKIGNPGPFIFLGFGFGIAVLGVSQLLNTNAQLGGAATYAVLVAAIAALVGGMWGFARGDTYLASIAATFGAWLLGFYLFTTAGVQAKLFAPEGASLYAFGLIIPVAIMMVPAIRLKATALWMTMIGIEGLLVFIGLGGLPISGTSTYPKIAAIFAFISALLLWYQGWVATDQMTAEMLQGAGPAAGPEPAGAAPASARV